MIDPVRLACEEQPRLTVDNALILALLDLHVAPGALCHFLDRLALGAHELPDVRGVDGNVRRHMAEACMVSRLHAPDQVHASLHARRLANDLDGNHPVAVTASPLVHVAPGHTAELADGVDRLPPQAEQVPLKSRRDLHGPLLEWAAYVPSASEGTCGQPASRVDGASRRLRGECRRSRGKGGSVLLLLLLPLATADRVEQSLRNGANAASRPHHCLRRLERRQRRCRQ
mmetsp:Transcript_22431/g.64426  ORF Transcript_22431/g.64426 Transcript_22431/m.64426 type:complete len:229 (-) Transcript_22431:203-889(-)